MTAPARTPISVRFTDYPSLVEAFRAIKDHLQLSNSTVDTLCGMVEGHTDKLLGPTCVRAVSPKSFGDLMWVFALQGTLTFDMERVRELEKHWEQRCAANTRSTPNRISKRVIQAATPHVLREKGRIGGLKSASLPSHRQASQKGGKSRAKKLSRARRKEIASKAAKARWAVRCDLVAANVTCTDGKSQAVSRSRRRSPLGNQAAL